MDVSVLVKVRGGDECDGGGGMVVTTMASPSTGPRGNVTPATHTHVTVMSPYKMAPG